MKRVLYIAFFFPPLGGAGVQRTLKFVRYLPDFGWRATVLTARSDYWMVDPTLADEIAPETRVLRTPFLGGGFLAAAGRGSGPNAGRGSPRKAGAPTDQADSNRRSGRAQSAEGSVTTAVSGRSHGRVRFLRAAARALLVPDAYVGWSLRAAGPALTELRSSSYDAIVTTSSPDSAHLLGRHLKRRTGVPWVADFRDPWTRRLAYQPPTRWHDRLHRSLEASCAREADRIIVTNEETRRDFLERIPGLPEGKIAVITNGYDEEDFVKARGWLASTGAGSPAGGQVAPRGDLSGGAEGPAIGTSRAFSILHAGQLNPERPIGPYLAGLRRFLDRSPERAEEARTLFLGGHYDRNVEEVRAAGLDAVVQLEQGRPHVQSIAALLQARVLLLIEHDSDRGRLILPGKVFEYLRANRPILAVVPAGGAAARLVQELDAGWVVDPARPESVAEGIDRTLAMGRNAGAAGAAPRAGDARPGIAQYERRALTERLAAMLDEAAGLPL